jgi:small GTP-binding protein
MPTTYKAVLVGDSGVGKTCIFQRFEQNTFSPNHIPTVGGAYARIDLGSSAPGAAVGLWDTAGQDRFRNIVPMYFQRASVVMIIFDIAVETSFDNIEMWLNMAKQHSPPSTVYLLIGNKSDLHEGRVISLNSGQEKAQAIGALAYIETSALTGDGCDLLLAELVRFAQSSPPVPDELDPVVAAPHESQERRCC